MANYFFIMNSTGTRGWRVHPIAEELQRKGHNVVAANLPQVTSDEYDLILKWADVLTFQMISAKDLVDKAKAAGIYTIFDCDDLIEEVPDQHPSKEAIKKYGFKSLFIDHTLKKVDHVTVASPELYARYKKYNKNITLLPNYLPENWERPELKNQSETIRIGWAGGMSHQEDLDFIAPVIKRIIDKYPQVKFVYTGGGGWTGQNPDKEYRFGKDHFSDIPLNRREYYMGTRLEMWPDRLNTMMLDIALAPLDDNTFSRCKTHIKYFEYAINAWAGVYQKFKYGVVKHGETGFLATTPAEWEAYIEKLINDPALRSKIGRAAFRDVKNHYTYQRQREWFDFYRSAGKAATSRVKRSTGR